MKDSSIPIAGLPDDFVAPDDEELFAFVNTLRVSVKARVAAEQQRGVALSEIVVQVREMVRIAEEKADHSKAFPSGAFPAILRQAVAWCVEEYRPPVVADAKDLSATPNELDSQSLPPMLSTVPVPAETRNGSHIKLVEDYHE